MSRQLKTRIHKFDNVRLFVMLMLVLGSFADAYTDRSDMFRSWFVFISAFVSPTLIFLSGLFEQRYDKGDHFRIRKFSLYITLGMALKLLIFALRRLVGEDPGIDPFGGATIEWYLFVIAMYMLTAFVLKRLNRWVMLALSVVLGVMVGFTPLRDEFYLMRYFVFMPFYFAGHYLTPMQVRRFSHKTNVKFAGIAFLFIFFVLCFRWREVIYPLRMLFTGRNPYSMVPIEGCTFYHRLLCYGISAILVIAIMACLPNRKVPILSTCAENTSGMYFWHVPLLLILQWAGLFKLIETLGDPMWKLTVLFSSIAFGIILTIPVFSWPLKKLGALFEKLKSRTCIIIDASLLTAAIASVIILQIQ